MPGSLARTLDWSARLVVRLAQMLILALVAPVRKDRPARLISSLRLSTPSECRSAGGADEQGPSIVRKGGDPGPGEDCSGNIAAARWLGGGLMPLCATFACRRDSGPTSPLSPS